MKTAHIVLIGGVITAFAFKDKIPPYIGGKVVDIEDKAKAYATSKIKITPHGLPSVGVDFVKGAVKLGGVIDLTSKVGFTATLNTYKINLFLQKGAQKIKLGSTPLETPNRKIEAGKKTALKYHFSIPLDSIYNLLNTTGLEGFQMTLGVDNLQVNGINIPSVKIDISRTWQDVAKAIKNPSSLITDIFKNL